MVISTTKAILFQMRFNNFWCNNLIGHKHKKKRTFQNGDVSIAIFTKYVKYILLLSFNQTHTFSQPKKYA